MKIILRIRSATRTPDLDAVMFGQLNGWRLNADSNATTVAVEFCELNGFPVKGDRNTHKEENTDTIIF